MYELFKEYTCVTSKAQTVINYNLCLVKLGVFCYLKQDAQ